jgi:hypothetical protein
MNEDSAMCTGLAPCVLEVVWIACLAMRHRAKLHGSARGKLRILAHSMPATMPAPHQPTVFRLRRMEDRRCREMCRT